MSIATKPRQTTARQAESTAETPLIIYSYSPVFYWWPVWVTGFVLTLLTFLDGGRVTWPSNEIDTDRNRQVETEGGISEIPQTERVQTNEADGASGEASPSQVRMSQQKYMGFVFVVVLLFVYFHSNVLWRGFRAYFFLAVGIAFVLTIMLIHTMYPQLGLWAWVKHIVYYAPDIYISMDGYLFISSIVLAVWLFVIYVYNRWTFMKFESGQVWIVEEIGEGENVYDTTNMTFEKQKEDFFRHHILGLGFLRPLGYLLPGRLARGLRTMTGTGDLIVRIGGDSGKVIMWPNVLNIDSKLERITTFIKSRPVVSA